MSVITAVPRIVRHAGNISKKVKAGDRRGATVAALALVLTVVPLFVPGFGPWLAGVMTALGGAEAASQLTVEAAMSLWSLGGAALTAFAPAVARHRAAYDAEDDLGEDDAIEVSGERLTPQELRRLLELRREMEGG